MSMSTTDHEGTMTTSSSSGNSDMGHYNDNHNNNSNSNSNSNSSSNNGNDAMEEEEEEGGTVNMRGMEMERLAEGGLFQSIPIPSTTTANHHLQPKEKTSKEAKIDSNKMNHEGKDHRNEVNPDRRGMIFQDGQWINPDHTL